MGPQLGKAAVVCAFLWCSVAALSSSSREVRGRIQLVSEEVRGGTDGCDFLTSQGVWGPKWFCLWALDLMEDPYLDRCVEACFCVVPNSVGFCGSRVCAMTLVGGHGIALFCSTA
ncbi:hypothetical protein Taro_000990 [Colocasia esculenta]|uniref:Secreted protein n=1 Tax=Colocasia esculenta TaxID=4460 RepID=A0A843TDL9_COLES|nr:hypothetical protein [Colocasia esculenta]